MKRFTFLLGAATLGSLVLIPATTASVPPVGAASLPSSAVVQASGSPPKAVVASVVKEATPTLPQYRVVAGDTLWGIGNRFQRTWPNLASFNRIPNPDLIYVNQEVTIPPASYNGPAPVIPSAPVHDQYTYAPIKQQVSTPVSHTSTYHVPPAAPSTGSSGGGGVWACIAQHESGGNPTTNTGNGYYGAFQDTLGSWRAAGGGPGLPSDYSYSQQLAVNQRIQQQQGWGAWPNTSRMCGV